MLLLSPILGYQQILGYRELRKVFNLQSECPQIRRAFQGNVDHQKLIEVNQRSAIVGYITLHWKLAYICLSGIENKPGSNL